MSDGVQKTSLIQSIIAQKGMSFAQPPNMGRGRFAYNPIKEPTSRPLFVQGLEVGNVVQISYR